MIKSQKHLIVPIFLAFCATQSYAQALLWEISGNGLSEKSYLFGSIHIQDKRVFQFDSVVWEKFAETQQFALEFDLENINQREVANRMMMQESYADLLSKDDYKLLRKTVKKHVKAPFFAVKRMKPFFVSTLISQSVLSQDEDDAQDLFFLKKARKAGKKILELESFEQQMSVIEQTSIEQQLADLLTVIKEPDLQNKLQTEAENLIQTYLSQDDRKLYELLNDAENESFMEDFLIKRNYGMLEKIQTFITSGGTFIVVGSGHLAGEEGLVQLLKNQHYTLTPIKIN